MSGVHRLSTTHALRAATPWGTIYPLILDPIWMVLAAIAVQITAIWGLESRIAEGRKPLYIFGYIVCGKTLYL